MLMLSSRYRHELVPYVWTLSSIRSPRVLPMARLVVEPSLHFHPGMSKLCPMNNTKSNRGFSNFKIQSEAESWIGDCTAEWVGRIKLGYRFNLQ